MFERVETLKLVARRQSTLIHSKSYLQTDSIHINTPNLMDLRINQLFNLTWQTLASWTPTPHPSSSLTDLHLSLCVCHSIASYRPQSFCRHSLINLDFINIVLCTYFPEHLKILCPGMNPCQFLLDMRNDWREILCVCTLSFFFVGISVINALLSPYNITYTPHLASDPMDYQFNFIFEC